MAAGSVGGRKERPLTLPQSLVLVRMADKDWHLHQFLFGSWYWYPRGQERMIMQGLVNRDLVERSSDGKLVLTRAGRDEAAYLRTQGWTVDGLNTNGRRDE